MYTRWIDQDNSFVTLWIMKGYTNGVVEGTRSGYTLYLLLIFQNIRIPIKRRILC